MSYHLKEREVGGQEVVEVDLRVLPGDVHLRRPVPTLCLVGYNRLIDEVSAFVDARSKSPAKQIHAHDADDI